MRKECIKDPKGMRSQIVGVKPGHASKKFSFAIKAVLFEREK